MLKDRRRSGGRAARHLLPHSFRALVAAGWLAVRGEPGSVPSASGKLGGRSPQSSYSNHNLPSLLQKSLHGLEKSRLHLNGMPSLAGLPVLGAQSVAAQHLMV